MNETLIKIASAVITVTIMLINLFGQLMGVGDLVVTQPTGTTTTTEQSSLAPTTPSTKPGTTNSSVSGPKFVFKVYGYGHGVGMSQVGAINMAKMGYKYDQILTYYYPGTTVKTDASTPTAVTYGGKSIPIVEYLCRTTKAEIGSGEPIEALKTQAVAAYTYAKRYNFNVASSLHAYSSSYKYEGTDIHKAVLSVLSMNSDSDKPSAKYLDYKSKAALTTYFASSAGHTASSSSVWGGEQEAYLAGGVYSPEVVDVTTVEISVEDMRKYINSYASSKDMKIVLDSDPAQWLKILSHDSAYDANTGYVSQIKVGDATVTGNQFRSNLLGYKIRSHCFTVTYVAK